MSNHLIKKLNKLSKSILAVFLTFLMFNGIRITAQNIETMLPSILKEELRKAKTVDSHIDVFSDKNQEDFQTAYAKFLEQHSSGTIDADGMKELNYAMLNLRRKPGNDLDIEPALFASKITGAPGQLVELPISIQNNPGLNGLQINLTYDSTVELVEIENGTALPSLTFTRSESLKSPVKFLWDGIGENETGNGVLLMLKFKISADVEEGTMIPIHMECPEEAVFDKDLNDVSLLISDGVITIK